MRSRWRVLAACAGMAMLVAAVGCNRGGQSGSGDAAAKTKAGRPSPNAADDPRRPVVRIETSLGNITVQLDADKAPLTVDNFLSYVRAGFYDQTVVHQVYKGQGILAGGYDLRLKEKPVRTAIRNEAQNGEKNRRGTIAMIRQPDVIDSVTSQFLINVADNPALDYKNHTPAGYGYCVFGHVTEGMDVVDAINNVALHDTAAFERTPVEPVVIKSIRRIR